MLGRRGLPAFKRDSCGVGIPEMRATLKGGGMSSLYPRYWSHSILNHVLCLLPLLCLP